MKLHLTNGTVKLTMVFDHVKDSRDLKAILRAKHPIKTAMKIAYNRLQEQVEGDPGNWYPIEGLALEGMDNYKQ